MLLVLVIGLGQLKARQDPARFRQLFAQPQDLLPVRTAADPLFIAAQQVRHLVRVELLRVPVAFKGFGIAAVVPGAAGKLLVAAAHRQIVAQHHLHKLAVSAGEVPLADINGLFQRGKAELLFLHAARGQVFLPLQGDGKGVSARDLLAQLTEGQIFQLSGRRPAVPGLVIRRLGRARRALRLRLRRALVPVVFVSETHRVAQPALRAVLVGLDAVALPETARKLHGRGIISVARELAELVQVCFPIIFHAFSSFLSLCCYSAKRPWTENADKRFLSQLSTSVF